MLSKVRSFFAERSILEVDTPILFLTAPTDLHIEPLVVSFNNEKRGYLHSSAEYGMKRLLSLGVGDIYQLSHVFRDEQRGRYHHPEFMMIEWYRMEHSFHAMVTETLSLIQLFVKDSSPVIYYTYAEAFEKFVGVDYRTATIDDLRKIAEEEDLPLPHDPNLFWSKETYLYFMMSFLIEPKLLGLNVIYHFPPSQAALAQVRRFGGEEIAERFEIYCHGVELANGFQELVDPVEQRHRFEKISLERKRQGKPLFPWDKEFMASLEKGIPPCCGVAVGFDRLLMLKLKRESLAEVLPLTL